MQVTDSVRIVWQQSQRDRRRRARVTRNLEDLSCSRPTAPSGEGADLIARGRWPATGAVNGRGSNIDISLVVERLSKHVAQVFVIPCRVGKIPRRRITRWISRPPGVEWHTALDVQVPDHHP